MQTLGILIIFDIWCLIKIWETCFFWSPCDSNCIQVSVLVCLSVSTLLSLIRNLHEAFTGLSVLPSVRVLQMLTCASHKRDHPETWSLPGYECSFKALKSGRHLLCNFMHIQSSVQHKLCIPEVLHWHDGQTDAASSGSNCPLCPALSLHSAKHLLNACFSIRWFSGTPEYEFSWKPELPFALRGPDSSVLHRASPWSPSCSHLKTRNSCMLLLIRQPESDNAHRAAHFMQIHRHQDWERHNLRPINIHENSGPPLPRTFPLTSNLSPTAASWRSRLRGKDTVLRMLITHSHRVHFIWRWVMLLIYFSSCVVASPAAPESLISSQIKQINWSTYNSVISHLSAFAVLLLIS